MTDKLRLISGNASTVLDRLIAEGIKVDMVFCSPNPPFYTKENEDRREVDTPNNIGQEDSFITYTENLMNIFEKVRVLLKNDGSLWFHTGDYSLHQGGRMEVPHRLALYMVDKYQWILNSELIWFRPEEYKAPKRVRFKKDYEHIYWFTKIPQVPIYDDSYLESSIIKAEYIPVEEGVWDSGFPHKLIEIPMKTCTQQGDTILDPFMGTGVTGEVALKLNRKFIGIELFNWKTNLTMRRLMNLKQNT